MKNTLILCILLFAFSCNNEKKEMKKDLKKISREIVLKEGEPKAIATMQIEGMSCEVNCAQKIKEKVSGLPGVKSFEIVFADKKASMEFDPTKITEEKIISEIENMNEEQYSVTQLEIEKTLVKKENF